ncbi:MAG: ribonuclease P protein component [Alphaproteobacteria bacterium]|nr:ribonuclease P protein component [Alphaproteobacteria bacterium]
MTETDLSARCAGFLIRARATRFPGDARYGLVATKKTFRHAVDRNRAKRMLRVWIRHNESWLDDDRDYVFIARPSILTWGRTDGQVAMKKALRYLRKQKIAPAQ